MGQLEPNPLQPRSQMDPARLAELAASIRESGVVQPILVRRTAGGHQIIAGERRWRAAQQAGLATVPVTVREVPDDRLLELALVENIQREELSPLEEAQAFQRLQQDLGLTQEEVARKVGRDRSTVANSLRLLRLPKEARDLLAAGRLEAGHARALLAVEHADDLVGLAREAARKGLSVREVERRVAQMRAPAAKQGISQGREYPGRGGAPAHRPRGPGRDPPAGPQRGATHRLHRRGRAQPPLRASPAGRPQPVAGVVS